MQRSADLDGTGRISGLVDAKRRLSGRRLHELAVFIWRVSRSCRPERRRRGGGDILFPRYSRTGGRRKLAGSIDDGGGFEHISGFGRIEHLAGVRVAERIPGFGCA